MDTVLREQGYKSAYINEKYDVWRQASIVPSTVARLVITDPV